MLVEEMRIELPGGAKQPEDLAAELEDDRTGKEYERRAESMPTEQAAALAVEMSNQRKQAAIDAEKTAGELAAAQELKAPVTDR